MKYHVLDTESDYDSALRRINALMDRKRSPRETEELRLLVVLVSDYEERHYPIAPPEPADAIQFHIERLGLGPREVAELFGGAEHAKAVLAGEKAITLALARKLHQTLGVSADILIQRPAPRPHTTARAAGSRSRTAAA